MMGLSPVRQQAPLTVAGLHGCLEVAPEAAKWTLLCQRAFCARELGLAESAEQDFAVAAAAMGDNPDPNFAHEM